NDGIILSHASGFRPPRNRSQHLYAQPDFAFSSVFVELRLRSFVSPRIFALRVGVRFLRDADGLALLPEAREGRLLADEEMGVQVEVVEGAGAAGAVDGGAAAAVGLEHATERQPGASGAGGRDDAEGA